MAARNSARARTGAPTPRSSTPVPAAASRRVRHIVLRDGKPASTHPSHPEAIEARDGLIAGDDGATYEAVPACEVPLCVRLSCLRAVARLERRHGTPDSALLWLNRALLRYRLEGLRAAWWESR